MSSAGTYSRHHVTAHTERSSNLLELSALWRCLRSRPSLLLISRQTLCPHCSPEPVQSTLHHIFPHTVKLPTDMAEQDRYGSHWGAKANNPTSEPIPVPVPRGSGAEQDRWAAHLSRAGPRNPEAEGASFRVPTASGAEQDRYAAHWSPSDPRNPEARGINVPVWSASGAEQDRYASHWSRGEANNPTTDRIGIPVRPPVGGSSEQEIYGSHFNTGGYRIPRDATAIGILKSTLLPSLGLHSGLAVVAYTASRVANRVDGKDWLWPAGQVANAWWSAVGARVVYGGLSLGTAFSSLVYPDKVLLGGVTVWGARLFYQVASRSLEAGVDDARYAEEKKEPGFWNKAFFNMFLPEAVIQAVISLPFTLPFRNPYARYVLCFAGRIIEPNTPKLTTSR